MSELVEFEYEQNCLKLLDKKKTQHNEAVAMLFMRNSLLILGGFYFLNEPLLELSQEITDYVAPNSGWTYGSVLCATTMLLVTAVSTVCAFKYGRKIENQEYQENMQALHHAFNKNDHKSKNGCLLK